MMQVEFLASPPPQKSQRITSNTTSKTLLPRTPKHHLISSLRGAFSGHPRRHPTYSLRSPSTTQLAPSTKAGFRKLLCYSIILNTSRRVIPTTLNVGAPHICGTATVRAQQKQTRRGTRAQQSAHLNSVYVEKHAAGDQDTVRSS